MSKKCCGIIYKNNEKFCTLCGKSLQDAEEVVDELPILDLEEVEKITAGLLGEEQQKTETDSPGEATQTQEESLQVEKSEAEKDNKEATTSDVEKKDEEDEEDDDDDDGQASPALKFFGTFMIILLIASIVAVGLGVYFIMINPFYRNHDINQPIIYDETATDTDVNNIVERPALAPVTLEEPTTTEVVEIATEQDAEAETQTETDAEEDEEDEE